MPFRDYFSDEENCTRQRFPREIRARVTRSTRSHHRPILRFRAYSLFVLIIPTREYQLVDATFPPSNFYSRRTFDASCETCVEASSVMIAPINCNPLAFIFCLTCCLTFTWNPAERRASPKKHFQICRLINYLRESARPSTAVRDFPHYIQRVRRRSINWSSRSTSYSLIVGDWKNIRFNFILCRGILYLYCYKYRSISASVDADKFHFLSVLVSKQERHQELICNLICCPET